jgi:hypothetical protein
MPHPFEYFTYRQGHLSAEEVSLADLAERFGTPTYVYSKQALLTPFQELDQGLVGIDHLICFAVKANSNLSILKLLTQAGVGFWIDVGIKAKSDFRFFTERFRPIAYISKLFHGLDVKGVERVSKTFIDFGSCFTDA